MELSKNFKLDIGNKSYYIRLSGFIDIKACWPRIESVFYNYTEYLNKHLPETKDVHFIKIIIQESRSEGALGRFYISTKYITIDPSMFKEEKLKFESVLLHELIHYSLSDLDRISPAIGLLNEGYAHFIADKYYPECSSLSSYFQSVCLHEEPSRNASRKRSYEAAGSILSLR